MHLENLSILFAFRFDFIEMLVQRFFKISGKSVSIFYFLVQIDGIDLDVVGNAIAARSGIFNTLEYVRV